jgi:hypothetical protein
MNIKALINRNLSNIPGWRTSRKILVIESDDWGSVRIKDKDAYEHLKLKGLNVGNSHYDSKESLESNQDLELLFELLLSFKDSNGRHPIFTPMCIMGNPDFEKIKQSDYQTYYFQSLTQTLTEYPNSSRIVDLWKNGNDQSIFFPELHGREHINVNRYLKILQNHPGKDGLRFALEHHSIGPSAYQNVSYPNYLGALHPICKDEIDDLHKYVFEAGNYFKELLGYTPRAFIAPNAEEPKELESTLYKIGIKYITRSKRRIYPVGDGEYVKEWNFIGKKNSYGQIILNRNAIFEPVAKGVNSNPNDWIDSCLNEIEIAFRWKKPALISSHRVNYVGSIDPKNRETGLNSLKQLLAKALKKWPDIEFMSSSDLGDLIRSNG